MPEQATYSRAQVALHWIIVALMAAQYLLHNGIEAAWVARMDGSAPNEPFPNPHAIVGVIIMALAVWRIVLRLRRGAPALPAEEPPLLQAVATATHIAFYVLLIGMPISGALAWVAGLALPAEVHEVAAKVMMGLIALHVAGPVAQKLWFKTDVMARMSPKRMLGKGASQ